MPHLIVQLEFTYTTFDSKVLPAFLICVSTSQEI